MPLDFRSVDEDEGFSMRRFLKTVGFGVAVFLVFLALGYYVIGPRLTFTPEGTPKLRWRADTGAADSSRQPPPMPKVEVYEKLPADVVASTGAEIGAREVAPFDYDRFVKRREKVRQQKRAESVETPADEGAPSDEETLIVPEAEPEPPPADTPAETPAELPAEPPAPQPEPKPAAPPPSSGEQTLYRVQVGVYDQRERANALVQTLNASGFAATIVPFQAEGRTRYRVQVLVTRDRAKAEQVKQQLESRGFPAYIAVLR